MRRELIDGEKNSDFLMDQSMLKGHADEIFFCHTSQDVIDIMTVSYRDNMPMTIQGGMTGICGGAVPKQGIIINMSEMNHLISVNQGEETSVTVQAGMTLATLNDLIRTKKISSQSSSDPLFFPPDPTETLATIGGMVSCDASGACSFHYGSTRHYIEGVKLVLVIDKTVQELSIKRGQYKYSDLKSLLKVDRLPSWQKHALSKDVAGLYYDDDMDLLDLFIGGEGILGIVTEIELRLIKAPKEKVGILLFLKKKHRVCDFVDWLRGNSLTQKPCAIEYFDKNTFDLLNEFRALKQEIHALPSLSEHYFGGIYLEFHLEDDSLMDTILLEILEQLDSYGFYENDQWLAIESADYEKLKKFRHAVAECVNILVSHHKRDEEKINKVATDMAVDNKYLNEIFDMYTDDLIKPSRKIVFGHMGDNHLHVNMIPKNLDEYHRSRLLVNKWVKQVIEWGGTVTAEHGIGKLKKNLLEKMFSIEDRESMQVMKALFDPKGLLNQGTLVDKNKS